nr:fibronectin type III domain-containing protein [Nakamurella flavida]
MTPTTDSLTDCTLGAGRSWRSPDGYTFTASQVDATGATVTVQTAAALGAPTGVTTRQDNTAGTATLTWAPPATDGGRPVTGYRVSRDGTGSTGTPAWSAWMPADARTRTFVNLAPGTPYTLTVRAVTAAGDGPPATRTVTMARTAGVPTQVTATRQDAAGTATLTWAPPATDGGRPVTGYRVSRNGTGSTGTPAWSAWMPADARTRTFVNLAPGTPYTLTVRAVTAAGDGPPATRTVTLAAR